MGRHLDIVVAIDLEPIGEGLSLALRPADLAFEEVNDKNRRSALGRFVADLFSRILTSQ